MLRALLRWTFRLALVATAAVVAARLLGSRSGSTTTGTDSLFPPIGGDTWPPVPPAPAPAPAATPTGSAAAGN